MSAPPLYRLVAAEDRGWAALNRPLWVPGRLWRRLQVPVAAQAYVLMTPEEPAFQAVHDAAAALRRAIAEVDEVAEIEPTVHGTWLYRPIATGAQAQEWLDKAIGAELWWPHEVTWVGAGDLRILYLPDSEGLVLTLVAWGCDAQRLLDRIADELGALPKLAATES